MIQPIHGHLLIRPIYEETFIPTTEKKYEEKGEVLAISDEVRDIRRGDIIYFDAWKISKYLDSQGNDVWLLQEEDIRAIERNVKPPLPE